MGVTYPFGETSRLFVWLLLTYAEKTKLVCNDDDDAWTDFNAGGKLFAQGNLAFLCSLFVLS
jgi:hypothetical protein